MQPHITSNRHRFRRNAVLQLPDIKRINCHKKIADVKTYLLATTLLMSQVCTPAEFRAAVHHCAVASAVPWEAGSISWKAGAKHDMYKIKKKYPSLCSLLQPPVAGNRMNCDVLSKFAQSLSVACNSQTIIDHSQNGTSEPFFCYCTWCVPCIIHGNCAHPSFHLEPPHFACSLPSASSSTS